MEILLSEFLHAIDINPSPKKNICNICEVIHMSDDILNYDENVEDKYEYGFIGPFYEKFPMIIDDNTKIHAENNRTEYWWATIEKYNK